MSDRRFVPDDFVPPPGLTGPGFRMVPLGPEHNESDYAAWSSSSAHIHATPGFEAHPWPVAMTRAENLGDLEQHARDHAERSGFTYTVLAPDRDEVIGCVYIYPARDSDHDAHVSSWVRAQDAQLDAPVHAAVSAWLAERWPFERVDYAARPLA